MVHKLTIWSLLLPMLLSGLWMVCNDGLANSGQVSTKALTALTPSEEAANCAKICAARHQEVLGPICILLPGGSKASITVIDFGAAILPAEIDLQCIATAETFVTGSLGRYSVPSLSYPTPPPRT